jgi:hypothetical protein
LTDFIGRDVGQELSRRQSPLRRFLRKLFSGPKQ